MNFELGLLKSDEEYRKRFDDLVDRKIVKLQNLIKAIFYLLGYNKEDICIEGTQILFWKKARHLWNKDFIDKLEKYKFPGCKEHDVKAYQTINFIEKMINGLS
jgi:hypothetical protein